MKGKRIVMAVTNDLTYDRRMYRICTALAESGAIVTLIGRHRSTSKDFQPVGFLSYRFRCWFNAGALFYAEYNIRLCWLLLWSKFDIACACDLDTAPAVLLSSWIKRKKTVYDAHEYFSEVPELTHRPTIKSIWEWIAKISIHRFDARYTVGTELAALMGQRYNVSFDVIRNIAPSSRVAHSNMDHDPKDKIILYQGALNVGRGLDTCIRAMIQLPEWTLWLAGEGDITESLKNLAQTCGVGDRVTFLGWVHPDQLSSILKKARLAINLREQGSLNDYYSLPNKFFDAIHAGLPSIHMNYPEYARIMAQYPCGILLQEITEANVVNAILHLEQHPEKWIAMHEACLQASKVFTWEKEAANLVYIYSSL